MSHVHRYPLRLWLCLAALAAAGCSHYRRDDLVRQEGFEFGYMQGQSDAIKRQYFLRLEQERVPLPNRPRPLRYRSYVLPAPATGPGGEQLAPQSVTVRIAE